MTAKKHKLSLTSQEFYLAVALAAMGFFFSARSFILYLDTLNPLNGLLVYYLIMFASLFVLSKIGLTVFNVKIERLTQIAGLLMISVAFFCTIDWESNYIQYVTEGNMTEASGVLFQSEDGAIWHIWHDLVGVRDIEQARLLTYVASPFLLALAGGYLVAKPRLLG